MGALKGYLFRKLTKDKNDIENHSITVHGKALFKEEKMKSRSKRDYINMS